MALSQENQELLARVRLEVENAIGCPSGWVLDRIKEELVGAIMKSAFNSTLADSVAQKTADAFSQTLVLAITQEFRRVAADEVAQGMRCLANEVAALRRAIQRDLDEDDWWKRGPDRQRRAGRRARPARRRKVLRGPCHASPASPSSCTSHAVLRQPTADLAADCATRIGQSHRVFAAMMALCGPRKPPMFVDAFARRQPTGSSCRKDSVFPRDCERTADFSFSDVLTELWRRDPRVGFPSRDAGGANGFREVLHLSLAAARTAAPSMLTAALRSISAPEKGVVYEVDSLLG